MKKNFFKKLSFVLALAMIVSVLAPAAGVFAAAAPKLNATKKYLHLSGEPGPNEFDFNIANKQKGWKYSWSSDNKNVVTVNKSGLATAKGVGTAKVSVKITNKDGEKVKTLSATVVVRDNIKTVKISNAPENNTLKVNESFDFNRSFVTLANSTKKTSSVTRWSVDKEGATINDSGVFTATVPGKYVVTARSFQSKAKYETWKVTADDTSSLILATDSIEITVVPTITDVKQINKTKFAVTFDADMSKSDLSATTATVYQIINGTKVNTGTEKIKEITFDSTGKVATVEMYSKFNPEKVYEFVYGDLVGTFTAAKVALKEVASVQFDDFTANINEVTDIREHVSGLNADGVVIYNAKDDSDFASTISFSGDLGTNGYLDSNNKNVYIYTEGFSTTLTAKFSYYVYNETTKVYDNITSSDTAVVTGVKKDNDVNTATMQYYIGTDEGNSSKTFATTGFKLAADDTGYRITTKYKINSDKDTWYYDGQSTVASNYTNSKFIYESSRTDLLIISGDYLYPIKEGTVTVIVKVNNDDKTVVGSFDLTIMPKRVLATATIDNPSLTVGNNTIYGANGTKTLSNITVKDNLDEAIQVSSATVTLESKPTNRVDNNAPTVITSIGTGDDKGKVFVKVDATGTTVLDGIYYFKIKLSKDNVDKYVFLTVNVLDGRTVNTVSSWRFEIDENTFDLKKVKDEKVLNYAVYGYNSKGAIVDKLTAGSDYVVTIKKDGSDIGRTYYDDSKVYVVKENAGGVLETLTANKTYAVEATLTLAGTALMGRPATASGASIGLVTFTVNDSSTKTFVVDKPTVATGVSLTAMDLVREALTLYLNGDKVTDENNIVLITYYDGQNEFKDNAGATVVGSGKSIYVKSVKYQVTNTGVPAAGGGTKTTITEYTFDIGVTIKCE